MAQNLLYPSYTYSHISGGDPIRILDLSVFLILHEFVWLLFYCLQISTLMQIIQCVLIIIIVTYNVATYVRTYVHMYVYPVCIYTMQIKRYHVSYSGNLLDTLGEVVVNVLIFRGCNVGER